MKDNEVKIYSVIVDTEGNDKWIAEGVFVDKPKLKTEVKIEGINDRLLQNILECTGLTAPEVSLITCVDVEPHNDRRSTNIRVRFLRNHVICHKIIQVQG